MHGEDPINDLFRKFKKFQTKNEEPADNVIIQIKPIKIWILSISDARTSADIAFVPKRILAEGDSEYEGNRAGA